MTFDTGLQIPTTSFTHNDKVVADDKIDGEAEDDEDYSKHPTIQAYLIPISNTSYYIFQS